MLWCCFLREAAQLHVKGLLAPRCCDVAEVHPPTAPNRPALKDSSTIATTVSTLRPGLTPVALPVLPPFFNPLEEICREYRSGSKELM